MIFALGQRHEPDFIKDIAFTVGGMTVVFCSILLIILLCSLIAKLFK